MDTPSICGITILRQAYRRRFDENYPGSDDSIFDLLEMLRVDAGPLGLQSLPPVRDLDYQSIAALVAVMRAYIRSN